MQEMKIEELKDKKGKTQAVEITFWYEYNCLYCNKKNSNVVFCSYECKNRHYENALAHLKSKCDESTCFDCKAFERRIENAKK